MLSSFRNAQKRYQNTRVNTASQKELLIMLLQGGIKFLRMAEESIQEEQFEKANNYLIRAQEVVNELRVSLDMERGGEFAERMDVLYDFMYRRLVQANTKKDAETVVQVREMFQELLDTWEQALQNGSTEASSGINQRA